MIGASMSQSSTTPSTNTTIPDWVLKPIGHIKTPFKTLKDCPRAGQSSDQDATLVIDADFTDGMLEMEGASHLIVFYWLDRSDRSILRHHTPLDGQWRGVFSTRSPNRPNPIGISTVLIKSIDGNQVKVSPMDCLNGTPLIDIKPYIVRTDSHPEAVLAWLDALDLVNKT